LTGPFHMNIQLGWLPAEPVNRDHYAPSGTKSF
jgi:hypothetical protein